MTNPDTHLELLLTLVVMAAAMLCGAMLGAVLALSWIAPAALPVSP
jgi:hypothetical protein